MVSIPSSTHSTSLQPNGVNEDQPKTEKDRLIHLLKGAALSGFGLACAFTTYCLVANQTIYGYDFTTACSNQEICAKPSTLGFQGIAAISTVYTAFRSLQSAYVHFSHI